MDEQRLKNIEDKVDDMHRALCGDDYGNHGFKQRLENVENKAKDFERKGWMIYGGSFVVGFFIAKGKALLAWLAN